LVEEAVAGLRDGHGDVGQHVPVEDSRSDQKRESARRNSTAAHL
jgi:hypothetical protein